MPFLVTAGSPGQAFAGCQLEATLSHMGFSMVTGERLAAVCSEEVLWSIVRWLTAIPLCHVLLARIMPQVSPAPRTRGEHTKACVVGLPRARCWL